MQGAHILPSFLHEGDQEVDGHGQVLSDSFFALVDGSDSGTHAVDFLGLELDGLFEFVNFGADLFSFRQIDRESTHLDEDVAQQFGDLFAD